jgi:hypothetical protein
VRDQIVFIGVAQEKAKAFHGTKVNGQFQFNRDKTLYVNHYYFYVDDEDFGPLFLKVCSYAPRGIKLCLNGHEWAKRQLDKRGIGYKALDNGFLSCDEPESSNKPAIHWVRRIRSTGFSGSGRNAFRCHCSGESTTTNWNTAGLVTTTRNTTR